MEQDQSVQIPISSERYKALEEIRIMLETFYGGSWTYDQVIGKMLEIAK